MEIAKLFARIGVKADSTQLNSFTKGLGQASSGLLKLMGLAGGAAGAIYALKRFTTNAMQGALALQNFSAATGVSAESLQKWKAVADQVSGSGQAVEAAISSIARNREALKLGEGNISPYQLLGIDPFQDPIKVLEDLRRETAYLPQAMKANIIQQMGLSSDLIPLLELTNEQFAQMSSRSYIMPQSAIDGLNNTRRSLTELSQAGKYFQGLIATGLAPGLKKFTDSLNQWLRQNPQVIEGIKKIGEGLGKALVAISRAASMINNLVRNTIGWKNALIGLGTILLWMNRSLLPSPIGLFTAAIIALLLILDDLAVYSSGKGKSFFAYLMNNSGGFRDVILGFFGVFEELKGLFNDLWAIVTKPEVIQFFRDLGTAIAEIVLDNIRNLIWGLSRIVKIVSAIIDGDWVRAGAEVLELLKENNPLAVIGRTIQAVDKATGGKISSAVDEWQENRSEGMELSDTSLRLLERYGGVGVRNAIQGKTTVITNNNGINIDIHSTDPVEAGKEVKDRLTPMLERVEAGAP